jgi:hypothetical protein
MFQHLERRALRVEDIYDEADETRRLSLILESAYLRALRDIHLIVTEAFDLDPAEFRLPDDAARDWAAKQAAARVTMISQTTRDALRELIADSIEDGRSTAEVIEAIERLFTETWKGRAEMVATSEITEAQRLGSLDRYTASGLVDRIKISDANRGTNHTDVCLARNGTTVPIDEAPAMDHPNCSILYIPVLREGVI